MEDTRIDWVGEWRNEYGSRLTIRDDGDGDGRMVGTFETALGDSVFAGSKLPIQGLHSGPCAHFAFASSGGVHSICSFTGLLRDGKLHMAWHVVSDQAVKSSHPGEPPKRMSLPWATPYSPTATPSCAWPSARAGSRSAWAPHGRFISA